MSILCGTDLSDASRGALAVARALATVRGDAEVVLVHAVDDAADATSARAALDAFAARDSDGVRVRAELVIGSADQAMCSMADREGSALIVVAASSSPPSLLRLGSTAEKLVVSAHVPVVVVRDPQPWLEFAAGARPLRALLGVDDSVACDLGIQWTHALRARGPIEVVLGTVYYPDAAAEHYGLPARAPVDHDPEIERLLERDMVQRFDGGAGVEARALRGLGRLGDHVVELAKQSRVDVIVIGTSQKTGLGRLGSVSSIVVHDAPHSVVCVPPGASVPTSRVPRMKRALVATDLSTFANRAVPFAFAITDEDGEVHVAHVVTDEAATDEDDLLRQLAALAPIGGTRRVTPHLLRGDDAATAIAQAAARLGADAICIASHGRSGLTRALVGSVADRLLRATRKPVLVLRPA